MAELSYDVVFITIVLSVIGSILAVYLVKIRNNRIKKKLEDLDEHEAFLERLSKGNIRLLRVTFCIILLALSSICFSLLFHIILIWLQPPQLVRSGLIGGTIGILAVTGVGCILQFNYIIDSANLKETKEKLKSKREKLQDKII